MPTLRLAPGERSAGPHDLELALGFLGDVSYALRAPPHLLSHSTFTIGVTLTEDAGVRTQKYTGSLTGGNKKVRTGKIPTRTGQPKGFGESTRCLLQVHLCPRCSQPCPPDCPHSSVLPRDPWRHLSLRPSDGRLGPAALQPGGPSVRGSVGTGGPGRTHLHDA